MNSDIFPPMPRPRYQTAEPSRLTAMLRALDARMAIFAVVCLTVVSILAMFQTSDYRHALTTLEAHRARLEADYGPVRTVEQFLDTVTTADTRHRLAIVWAEKIDAAKARGDYLAYCADNVTLWRTVNPSN